MRRLSLAALFLASCGDPYRAIREAQFYRVDARPPGFRSLVGKKAPRLELPDQHGTRRPIPPKGRACAVLFADANFLDFALRWKKALRARYPRLRVRWVVRVRKQNAALKAARLVPAGTWLHSDVEKLFESQWGTKPRGVYVFFVDGGGVVRAAVRGAWTFEKMEGLFSAIDDSAR